MNTPSPQPSKGDGCTVLSGFHLWLIGRDVPMRGCCEEHDLFYEQGGSRKDRAFADKILRECTRARGYPVSAWLMWLAVRCFGWLYWNTSST